MYQKTLTAILMVAALMCLGTGITGFYALSQDEVGCFTDGDCMYSVCCELADEDFGVCAQEDECAELYLISSQDDDTDGNFRMAGELEEDVTQSYIAVALGLILLLIIGIVSYIEWHQGKTSVKKTVKKRKKKSKK
ncbi:MAG: hypothetical protein ISS01_00465 [Nanoarchaeota archaeon]|nr:hypothetical protein [Nanoarchaeota archaeon]